MMLHVIGEPEELAEGLVVGDGFVIVLREGVLDVLETPLLHQLTRRFGFLDDKSGKKKVLRNFYEQELGMCYFTANQSISNLILQ